ncbi:MAG: collagen binding domain-containing protein [Lawsonibacter sp.]
MANRDMYLLRRSEEFHLDSGQEVSVNLKLEKSPSFPCTKLCGQVVSNCTKIQSATVKVLAMDSRPICHTQTDRDGLFSFIDTLFPGNYEIIVSAENYLISESRLISLKPFVPLYVTIKLIPDQDAGNAAVYGTVRNGENIPLPNTLVRILSKENVECNEKVTRTNEDGEYLFASLKPGKYVISALCYDYTLPEAITVEVLPNDIFCADLYLYRNMIETKGTISGVVLQEGHTVPYAVTALYRKESSGYSLIQIQQANGSGVYLFPDLKAGEYIVRAKLE